MLRSVCAILLTTLPATAQDGPLVFPIRDVLNLASAAYLDPSAFESVLADVLPVTSARAPSLGTSIDPFLWSLNGHFGDTEGYDRPSAIFGCARYGLETRDQFATYGQTATQTFALLGYARPQFNDAEVWPDGAVARLHCFFVWDDRRVVEIVPEAATAAALAVVFDTLTLLPQDTQTRRLYGEDGFRIDASHGPGDSVVQIESARMTLTQGHQSFTFRSFLMGVGF